MPRNYKDITGERNGNYRTGFTLNKKQNGFYNTWQNIKQKCYNKNNPKYKSYGGRGIKVCEEWLDVKNFHKWAIENGWRQGLTIDRIDNDGDYCPENCSWLSHNINSKRKRTTKITDKQANLIRERFNNGEKMSQLGKEFKVSHGTIWFIIKNFTHVKSGECSKRLKENRLTKLAIKK